MALVGAWRGKHSIQSGALKWGTGSNPVKEIYGEGPPLITAKQVWSGPGTEGAGEVPESIEEYPYHYDGDEYYGGEAVWGYGTSTGTSARPGFGVPTQEFRGQSRDWPAWGPYEGGIPGGSAVRDDNIGAELSKTPKQEPDESVTQGWRNKDKGTPGDSRVSDGSQLIVQTSQTQRYKVREGSQAATGRANEFDAPIASRVVGKKVKRWAGTPHTEDGQRHEDMYPRDQDQVIRKWWARNAGTGPVTDLYLQANDAYESTPRIRTVPSDPYQGRQAPEAQQENNNYGYIGEDVLPYV